MSPNSVDKKKKSTLQERANDKRALKKYSFMDVSLDYEQNEEISSLVSKIIFLNIFVFNNFCISYIIVHVLS